MPWSACDVTCDRGRRTRERTCSSVGWGQDCGNRCPGLGQQVDDCRNLPPCGQSWDWTEWNAWCPCECKTGLRARRRRCEQRDRFSLASTSDISKCSGPAREEERCDVRKACPACVEDCAGRREGSYPSCNSCAEYIQCTRGRSVRTSCEVDYEYDAFIEKCAEAPSPSCTLHSCVESCAGLNDGRYPACSECRFYIQCTRGRLSQQSCPPNQEFNAHHGGRCAPGLSPTCIRPVRNRLDLMFRDAPPESYFKPDKLSDEERKAQYLALWEKTGVAAKFNRTEEDVFRAEEERAEEEERKALAEKEAEALKEKLEEEEEDLEERIKEEEELLKEIEEEAEEAEEEEEDLDNEAVVIEKDDEDEEEGADKKDDKILNMKRVNCQKDCSVGMGRFQSCKGCRYFLVCTKHGLPRHVKCPRHKYWDDKKKKCKRVSTTCIVTNDTKPLGSAHKPDV